MSALTDGIAAAQAIIAAAEKVVADVEAFNLGALAADGEAAAEVVAAKAAPVFAAVKDAAHALSGQLSAFGVILHEAGLGSAGPNVPNSVEGNGTGSGVA